MKIKTHLEKTTTKARAGFSLVSVLIISVVSMAIMGGIAYMFNSYAGSSRVTIAQGQAYNTLQEGIEQGKAVLREAMKKTNLEKTQDTNNLVPLDWNYSRTDNDIIEDLEELRVKIGPASDDLIDKAVIKLDSGKDYQTVTVGGEKYKYRVRIYDMRYAEASVDLGSVEREQLPPAMPFAAKTTGIFNPNAAAADDDGTAEAGSGGNYGIYLVRATLTPMDAGRVRLIETAVIQAIDDEK